MRVVHTVMQSHSFCVDHHTIDISVGRIGAALSGIKVVNSTEGSPGRSRPTCRWPSQRATSTAPATAATATLLMAT